MEYKEENSVENKEAFPERKKFRYEQNLIKKREKAIKESDGVNYVLTTLSLGFNLDEVPGLAEEGYAQMALDTKKSMDTGGLEEISLELDKELKEQLKFTKIMNSTSYKSIMQSKTRLKLKRVLGELQRAGYEIDYSPDMSTSEMLNLYFPARKDILNL